MSDSKALSTFSSLIELTSYLADEAACLRLLEQWQGGEQHCPFCGMTKIYKFRTRAIYKCASCGEQFSIKVGTIFEKSKVPIKKWILAIYLNGANKKGISSHQLGRELNVSQKTAWFMLHRIRKALQPVYEEKMTGVILSDETFVGGKNKNRHLDKKVKDNQGRSFKDKTPVVGFLANGKELRCFVIPTTTRPDLIQAVKANIEYNSVLVTDEWNGYSGLGRVYNHVVVNHKKYQYKTEEGHSTNAVEGFWSHLKRTIFGIYHNVSKKHLQRYVDEITFRYNTRHMNSGERFRLMLSKINTRLTYKQLVYGT